MAAHLKALESYLVDASAHRTSMAAYAERPATAFLRYLCDAYDAFVHCMNKFTKKSDGTYNKDSEDSLRHIACAVLGTAMGHFETYQKAVFAGLVERSASLPAFDVDRFLKSLDQRGGDFQISPSRLLAFRTLSAPVGLVIADSLGGWHNPPRVISYIKAMGLKQDMYSNSEVDDLNVLWQLRHSIVHTGAWLTIPDANKVKRLAAFRDKPIVFNPAFISAFSRRLHKIVKKANGRLLADCIASLGVSGDPAVVRAISNFLDVKSPKSTWL